ncbi:tRNA (adenosine(37)-N6)-threonylcarbamoyltransferase complex dimerization subunit type 1 TsaB [Pedobacter sp.]|uniref:tRNA (adenosine(37)-N6)-threonylcarbamoyltransferase complex dimerization subunit type 1 TsaB n=1 Tax=Pedobacter sp. TaxID=1411316 RepID=UPI003D7F2055
MAHILQIETATQTCSVALAVNGVNVALKEETATNIHAGSLTLFIEAVMKQASLSFQQLDAVAVSMGPGSYTGLRIGVSTAKGLCYALDKPLIAVNTLAMMANGFLMANPSYQGLICPMIDARRMEVYTSLFNQQMETLAPVTAKIIEEDSFKEELQNNEISFIGDGALKCSEILQHPHAVFSGSIYNSAANMAQLAHAAFLAENFVDVAYFEPYYLKDFMFTTPKKKV